MDKLNLNKASTEIRRQRISPRIWDFSYLLTKNNLAVFKKFKDLVLKNNNSRILDVGCGFKPWLSMFQAGSYEYIGVDMDADLSSSDVIALADLLPFADGYFDALIYSAVLEHIENLSGALKEMRRVSRNGALVFISAPFVFYEHGIPNDFWRFTEFFYRSVFKNDEIVVMKASNSSLSSIFVFINLCIESSPVAYVFGIKQLKYFIFITMNLLGLFMDTIIKTLVRHSGFLKRFEKSFYTMPIEYCVIVKIKK